VLHLETGVGLTSRRVRLRPPIGPFIDMELFDGVTVTPVPGSLQYLDAGAPVVGVPTVVSRAPNQMEIAVRVFGVGGVDPREATVDAAVRWELLATPSLADSELSSGNFRRLDSVSNVASDPWYGVTPRGAELFVIETAAGYERLLSVHRQHLSVSHIPMSTMLYHEPVKDYSVGWVREASPFP
jgi:hypothetical protein